jgi:hypothetical protein
VISEFTVFGQDGCNQDSLDSFTFRKGDDSDKCLPFAALTNNQTVKSITETAGDFKCQRKSISSDTKAGRMLRRANICSVTVFMKDDCSDPGLQIGIPQPGAKPGCESDNLQAFKIQCPWWN